MQLERLKRDPRLSEAVTIMVIPSPAAYRAQGDALLIESQAKMRLADEYDAAQEAGEVASAGQPSIVADGDNKPATVAHVGLTRQQVHEARQIRDAEAADPGVIRRTVDERVAAGMEPTKAAIREAVRIIKDGAQL